MQATSKLDDLLAVRKDLDADIAEKDSQLATIRNEVQALRDEVRVQLWRSMSLFAAYNPRQSMF